MTGAKVGEVIMLPVSEAQALQQCGRVEILPN
jgi:hypothetical protein